MYFKKSLGQHFLKCDWVVKTLIKSAHLTKNDTILEIGPGTGVLTRELARAAGRVIAIEKDENLAQKLAESLQSEHTANIEILEGDIIEILRSNSILLRSKIATGAYKIVANIPYYLTSHLLKLLLETDARPASIILTIQHEVAQRITAQPPHMNLLALSIQAYGKPKIIKKVPKECFSPMPKVDSAIIHIVNISHDFFEKNRINKEFFFKVLKRAFSQKRKILLNSLEEIASKETLKNIFLQSHLSPTARPQELSLLQWSKIIVSMQKTQS